MATCNTIHSDFGSVACGQKATHLVKIRNRSKRTEVLAVREQHKDFEFRTERLKVQPVEVSAKPGSEVLFTLTYASYVGNVTENYCYEIINSQNVVAKLCISAKSVGPSITPTVFNLKFFRFRGLDQTVKQVILANDANCEAKFFFDLDEDFQPLEISERRGVIPANRKIHLKFTFKPSKPGVYRRKIFCIVQFHTPIIFNVLAVYRPKAKVDVKSLKFRGPLELDFADPSEAYMARFAGEMLLEGEKIRASQSFSQEPEQIPKVPTSKNANELAEDDVSFQRLLDNSSEAVSKSATESVVLIPSYLNIRNWGEVSKAVALVNLSESQPYFYEWDEDPKGHFHVSPSRGAINPNSKVHFMVRFTPSVLDFMYHVELDVKILESRDETEAESPQVVDLPLILSLRIIGNSFPDDSCGWVPQCTATPKSLHLRPCVPGEKPIASFMLERQGHLPVSFVVCHQKEQYFNVQPALGYLSENFQLLLVQFCGEWEEPGIYKEDVTIKFNDSDSCTETVRFWACVEIPKLIFGRDNYIRFPPVAVGSKTWKNIRIENPTNLYLRYELVIPEDMNWIELVNPTSSVAPKAFGTLKVIFRPHLPWEYLDRILCLISSTSEIGYTQEMYLYLSGSCQYGHVVATPSILDFGDCIVGEKKTADVHLFNFSSVLLNFRLTPEIGDLPIGDPRRDISIVPREGTLTSKESVKVQVKIKVHKPGPFHYVIKCQNVAVDLVTPCGNPTRIVSLKFEGMAQVTKVVDVIIKNGGPLFSPQWLWKMLALDRVNQILKSPGNNCAIKLSFPEAPQNANPVTVSVIFESGDFGSVSWQYRVEINCPCLEGSMRSLVEGMECKHTKAVFIPPPPQKLTPKTRTIMQITLKYEEASDCEINIIITSEKKSLNLRIPVPVQSTDKPSRGSLYTNGPFLLKPVFIGDPLPPVQLFWIYNNSSQPAAYSVDQLDCLGPARPGHRIFVCVNPAGVIPPFSSMPLAFLFSPAEAKTYRGDELIHVIRVGAHFYSGSFFRQGEVTVSLDETKSTRKFIKLKGAGVLRVNQVQELALEKTMPEEQVVHCESLECSQNHVNIPFFRIFSQVKRLFFLKNKSKKDKWAFRWHSFHAENILNAHVRPEKGVIEPKQSVLMTLFVESFCHPTTISASVPCDVLNYSQLEEHRMSLKFQEAMKEEVKECFTITDKGTSQEVPDVTVAPEPEPRHAFFTVNANIVGSLYIDLKISPNQQSTMEAELEIQNKGCFQCPLKSSGLQCNQEILEKMLWNVLCSSNVGKSVKNLQGTEDYLYLQLKSETIKAREESIARLRTVPRKNNIQRFLEMTINEVLCKHFLPNNCL